MLSNLEGVILTLLFIVPGILAARAESKACPKREKSDAMIVLNSLAYAFIIQTPFIILALIFMWLHYHDLTIYLMQQIYELYFGKLILVLSIYWLMICILGVVSGFYWGTHKDQVSRWIMRRLCIETRYRADVTVLKSLYDEKPPEKVIEVTFYVEFPGNRLLCYLAELAGFDPLNDEENPSVLLFKNVRIYNPDLRKFMWVANAYDGTVINKSKVILSHYRYKDIQKSYPQSILWIKQPEISEAK